jgi:hypothetical protein
MSVSIEIRSSGERSLPFAASAWTCTSPRQPDETKDRAELQIPLSVAPEVRFVVGDEEVY